MILPLQWLDFIHESKVIDPDEWFFKAHFCQDPDCLQLYSFTACLYYVLNLGLT